MSEKLLRTCIACKTIRKKEEFFRVVYNKKGEIFPDLEHKLDGRGAYICKNADCMTKCIKKKSLNRAFKQEIPKELYDSLSSTFLEH